MVTGAMRTKSPGPERYILVVALILPLGLTIFLTSQLSGFQLRLPFFDVAYADAGTAQLVTRRPAASSAAPPPTLVPAPTPTVAPTVALTATPARGRTYTVQPGDELKNIAADYGVSIWKIIDANTIADPDKLGVGQVLRIPDD
jgi:LysM repeat protein